MSSHKLSDDKIVHLIVNHLEEDDRIAPTYITVDCQKGIPVISGRVASDHELQVLEELMNDLLEINNFENHVWVDDTLAFQKTAHDAEGDNVDLDDDSELNAEEPFESDEDEEL